MNYQLHLRYLYTFYSFDDILTSDLFEERIPVSEGRRFALHEQEGGTFVLSDVRKDAAGRDYVILTFPSKENLMLLAGDETELAYEEIAGDEGEERNVYEGTVALVAED